MGKDDLFHKRKAKKLEDIKRRKVNRQQYHKVLIVCEGQKTEPYYFRRLKDHYRLNTASIEICSSGGSDPRSIIQFAKKRYLEEKSNETPLILCFVYLIKIITRHMKCPWKKFEKAHQKTLMCRSTPFHALNIGYCFISSIQLVLFPLRMERAPASRL